jgi:hypothetical protein
MNTQTTTTHKATAPAVSAPPLPKIRIHVEGGVVQSVYTDLERADIEVIDFDHLEETHTRNERENFLYDTICDLNEIGFGLSMPEPVKPEEEQKPQARCPSHPDRELVYYDGWLGYSSFVCPVCHWDVNDVPTS